VQRPFGVALVPLVSCRDSAPFLFSGQLNMPLRGATTDENCSTLSLPPLVREIVKTVVLINSQDS
jgi:hypothetical protein